MFTIFKDWGVGKVAETWLRGTIGKYAELKTLSIDSRVKKLLVVIRPKGEPDDIEVKIDQYCLSSEGEKSFVTVSHVHCSREWIRLIAIDHLVGKKIEIPGAAAKLL